MSPAPRVLILSSSLDSAPRTIELTRPMTVGEIVAAENVALSLPTIAVMTDALGHSRPVMRGEWHTRQVTPGHQLAFVPVPGRGSLSSILAAVAGIALAIVAPWAAGAIVGAMGLTGTTATIATSLITGGIMIAGQFIINRLLGPPQQASADSVFSARASNNRATPLEPIPAVYGLMRYAPPYAARPYAEFVDNDQYLYQLHCLTIGHADPLKWEIGETVVWTQADGFQGTFAGGDAEIEIIRPGDEIKLFPANVVIASTVDGQQVPDAPGWLGPFAVSAPGIKVSRIACDYVFPLGLIHIDKKGRGATVARTIKAEYRRINDAGVAIGGWQTLIDFEHRAATRTPQRFSRSLGVPEDRYEVRFGASGADTSDNTGKTSTLNRVLWAGLRGYVEGFETPPDCTLVATKIRATENLSREAAGQYLWTCQRLLPVWSAANGWSAPVATRSPAWAAADLLARLGVPDADYDLGWLETYAAIWQARGDRFDAVFDRRWQASEALDAILRVGRSYHVRLGSMIGFVRDEPRQVRRMAFTPDTVVRGSIQREDIWFSEDQPDALKVVYLDGETWRERDVMAAIGAIGDEKPQEMPAFGITDHDHGWREGIFTAAENAFRRSFRTFQVEREGRMLVRGDPVVLHDPLLDVVLFDSEDSPGRKIDFARLMDRDGDTITLDRAIIVEPGETYHLVLRDRRGREWGPCLVQSIEGTTVVLNAADRGIVEAQHGSLATVLPNVSRQEPAHVTLLKGDYRLFDGLVLEARPLGPDNWEVTIVNDDQRVHAVDQTEPVPAPWTPPAMIAPVPESPTVRGVYGLLQQGTLGLTLEAGWQPAAGADRYVAEISYDEDAATDPAAATWTPVHDSRATRLSVTAMPQPLTLRVAGVGKVQGEWAYTVITAVPELRLPDEVVDPLVEEMRGMLDWLDEDGPLNPLWQDIYQNAQDIAQEQLDRAAAISAEAAARANAMADEATARANAIAAERGERLADVADLSDRARALHETVKRTAFTAHENWLAQKQEFVVVRDELASVDYGARAYAEDVVNLAIGPGSAVAERFTTIEAQASANYATLDGAIQTVQSVALDAVSDEATARQALRIQLVGNYTGDDVNQVTEGLLWQDRQAWISETEALANAIDLMSAGVGILFDWIDQWSFNTSVEGWTGNGDPSTAGGWLRPADHASEPYVVSPDDLGFDGDAYRQIKLRIRKTGSPMWRGQFWWQGEVDTTWDAARRATLSEPSYVDGIAVVTVDMGWAGLIDRLRVDLSEAQTNSDYFEIDWLSVGRPSPGASQAQVARVQQALASQILAETSSRETLSAILTGLDDPSGATLPSLTQGLIYDERVARAAGDGANLILIQGIAAQIDDPNTGLGALAQAQSTLENGLSNLGGVVSGHASIIDDLLLSVDGLEAGKADVGITDGLQAQIDQLGGGSSLSLVAEAVRSLRLTVDRMALGQANVWLAGKKDRTDLGDIVAEVDQSLSSRIDVTDEQVTLQGQIIDQINLDLGGKAGLDITNALDGRVTASENSIEAIGESLLLINGSIGDLESGKADASVLVDYRTVASSYDKGETDGRITTAVSAATLYLENSIGNVAGDLGDLSANLSQNYYTGTQTDDEISSAVGAAVGTINLALDDKADVSIVDGIQASIDQMGGGTSTSQLASAVRALRLTVDHLALGQSGLMLAGKSDRMALGDIVAEVDQSLSSRIDVADDKIVAHGEIIDRINLDLGGKAGLDITSALTGRIEVTESSIVSQGVSILSIQSALNGYDGPGAVATALSQRYTKTETDAEINGATTALVGLIEDVEASVGNVLAGGRVKIESQASSGAGWSTIGILASANDGASFEEAAILLDARTTGAVRSRVVLKAAQTAIMDAGGNLVGLFGSDGLTMENIRLGTLRFNRLESHDDKLVLSGGSGGTFIRMST